MDRVLYELQFGRWLRLTPSLYQVSSELTPEFLFQTLCGHLFNYLYNNLPDSYEADDRSLIIGSSHKIEEIYDRIREFYDQTNFTCQEI